MDARPDWQGTDGVTVADVGPPSLFVLAGEHDPDVRFGRRDLAEDEVQVLDAQLTGSRATWGDLVPGGPCASHDPGRRL